MRNNLRMLRVDLARSGVPTKTLRGHRIRLREALANLDASPHAGFLRVLHRRDLARELNAFARARRGSVRDVVQLGIGGSSLGGQAVCAALLPPHHNTIARGPVPRFHFVDNVDPESFAALLETLDPRRTLVHVVSKTGGTLETQAQLYALLEAFRRKPGFRMQSQVVATTGSSGALRELADREGLETLTFPADVPGRYSVFTASGMLVPALCGIPVGRILAGAREMEQRCRRDALLGPAGRLATVYSLHDLKYDRPIHVEFVYTDALVRLADWFRQIWAESLGKGGRGPTPVVARGTTDQHSQIQLYVDGPDDKLYTFLRTDAYRKRVRIARNSEPRAIAGRDLGDVFDAEAEGTIAALREAGRPLIQIHVPRVGAEVVGALLLMQQLQTALAGALYGCDPFTQPGVDAGKHAAMRILEKAAARQGRAGSPRPGPRS